MRAADDSLPIAQDSRCSWGQVSRPAPRAPRLDLRGPDPEAIMQMPAGLWRSLELASVLMGADADLTLPPCFDGAG